MQTLSEKMIVYLRRLITEPGDSEVLQIRRMSTLIALAIGVAGYFSWFVMLLIYGFYDIAVLNGVLNLVSLLNLWLFIRTKNYSLHANITMVNLYVITIYFHINLGGYFQSGMVSIWLILTPIISALILDRRNTIFWMIAAVGSILGLAVFEPVILANAREVPLSFKMINVFWTLSVLVGFLVPVIRYLVTQLNLARDRADTLLLNMLPEKIAVRLKQSPGTIAEHYDQVSILFSDIVGFTPLSATLSPVETVELLNEIYSAFDVLVEKHGLEKISTIGDNYMVASGLPEPRSDHAQALIRMAIDMLEFLNEFREINPYKIDFRIGIHSGPVVAGVIGNKKFQYDVWGDTVNTASRMESHGVPGKIHISDKTYQLVKHDFEFEDRGEIDIKGKGQMQTWFVTN